MNFLVALFAIIILQLVDLFSYGLTKYIRKWKKYTKFSILDTILSYIMGLIVIYSMNYLSVMWYSIILIVSGIVIAIASVRLEKYYNVQ